MFKFLERVWQNINASATTDYSLFVTALQRHLMERAPQAVALYDWNNQWFHSIVVTGWRRIDDTSGVFVVYDVNDPSRTFEMTYGVENGRTMITYGAYRGATLQDPDDFETYAVIAERPSEHVCAACSYTLSASDAPFNAAGGQGSVHVNAGLVTDSTASPASCPWTVTASDPWISIVTDRSSAGNGDVSFSVAANTGPARFSTIVIGGQTFTVSQAAPLPPCAYTLSTNSLALPAATAQASVALVTAPACAWTASPSEPWISILGDMSGAGSASVQFTVAANIGAARSGTITIAGQTVTVSQAAAPPVPAWNARAPMRQARYGFGIDVLDGRAVVAGGIGPGDVWLNSVEAYDPQADLWRDVAPLSVARHALALVNLDGTLYAIGGSNGAHGLFYRTVEAYDPPGDRWIRKADLPRARSEFAAAGLDGKLYVFPGVASCSSNDWAGVCDYSDRQVLIYDASSDRWSTGGTLEVPPADGPKTRGAVVIGNRIYVVVQTYWTAWQLYSYDPATGVFVRLADLPQSSGYPAVTRFNGELYVLGGVASCSSWSSCTFLNLVQKYDPISNAWTLGTPATVPRDAGGAAVVAGTLYFVGGYNNTGGIKTWIAVNEAFR